MQRRTLSLIAIPATLAATAVAVPALAGTGTSPAAHAARTRTCHAVIVISNHRRIRACLLRGPRGFTGPAGPRGATGKTGPTGKTGKTGAAGKNGTNGINGTNGTARAYALVRPTSPSAADLIGATSVISVSEISAGGSNGGVYCITPAAGIAPSAVAAVSPEVSYSAGGAPGTIAVNAQHTHCPASTFEVDTYTPGTTTLASGYAFTIIIP
jgi:hypothetical protein